MTQKQFKRRLKEQESIAVSDAHLRQTVALCRKELDAVKTPRIGFWQFMVRQIRFADKKIWAAQLLAILVLGGYMRTSLPDNSCQALPLGLALLGIFLALVSVTSIERSRQYSMLELELSTRVSVPRQLLAKMLITGGSSLLVMLAVFCVVRTYLGFALPFLSFTVCTYLLMSALCAWIVQLCRARSALLCCLCAGVLLFGLLLFLREGYTHWFIPEVSGIWWALCIPFGIAYIVSNIAGFKNQGSMDWLVN